MDPSKLPPRWLVRLFGESNKIGVGIAFAFFYLWICFFYWIHFLVFLTGVAEVLKFVTRVVELLRDAIVPGCLRGLLWRVATTLGKKMICFPFSLFTKVVGPFFRKKKENENAGFTLTVLGHRKDLGDQPKPKRQDL